jgi:hypothetical protein
MSATVEKIDVSAPVLVYERPRFTEPMFVKAKDAPLKPPKKPEITYQDPRKSASPSKKNEIPRSASRSSTTSPPPKSPSYVGSEKGGALLRRLSSSARSLSSFGSFRRDSVRSTKSDSPTKRRSTALGGGLSRRMSKLFRSASFSSPAPNTNAYPERQPKKDELIVYVDEQAASESSQ